MDDICESKTARNKKLLIKNTGELKEPEHLIDCFGSVGFAYFRILLDKSGKPCDFQFLKVNSTFEQVMGLRENEVIGRTGLEVFQAIEQNWIDTFGRVAITGEPAKLTGYFESYNKYFAIDVFSPQKGFFAVIFTDITETKIQQDKLYKLYQFQKVMNRTRKILLDNDDEEETLYRKVCESLVQINFIKIAGIVLVQSENIDMDIAAVAGADENIDYVSNVRIIRYSSLSNGIISNAIKTGKPIVVNDMMNDDRFTSCRVHIAKMDLKSVMALPLFHESVTIGAMVLYSDQKEAFGSDVVFFLGELSTDIAIGVKTVKLRKNLRESNKQLKKAIEDILAVTSRMIESRDPYTSGHQKRVAQLSMAIAKKIGLPDEKIEMIKLAALVHDIGKIAVPAEILVKPTKLSQNEFNLIKDHPQYGYNFLKDVIPPWDIIAMIALQHHEKLDGSGYPQGLKEEEIVPEAKIVAVADVVEAISTHRPYRPALGIDIALEEISNNKGKLYDPEAVDACIKLFKEDGFKFD
jgi:HD-GYP domain-containing protein (c-di-GMP phosphodiesterase class II)